MKGLVGNLKEECQFRYALRTVSITHPFRAQTEGFEIKLGHFAL